MNFAWSCCFFFIKLGIRQIMTISNPRVFVVVQQFDVKEKSLKLFGITCNNFLDVHNTIFKIL